MKAIVCDFCREYEHGTSAYRVKISYYDMDRHRAVDVRDLCADCFEALVTVCKERRRIEASD